jgi:hypothetical protein|tara:strand:+ start:413 stop:529 length:117 start_codon:yes stop_codon:yes gene_type:complete
MDLRDVIYNKAKENNLAGVVFFILATIIVVSLIYILFS